MATQKYLDNTGLAYFWGKIKAWVTGLGYITSSGSITGNAATATKVSATIAANSTGELVRATMAANDAFRIAVGGASNAGYVEIATADDYSEPIYVRQYQGGFATLKRTATLLDGSGNTSFPGTVTANAFSGPLTGNVTGNVTGNCSGSSGSCTGNAATATKLGTSNVGASNNPIYLNAGVPTATGGTLAKTIQVGVGAGSYSDMLQTLQSDNNNYRSCTIRCENGNGYNTITLGAHNEANGAPGGIYVKNAAGTITAGAPEPAADANDGRIATTKWVKARGYITSSGSITGSSGSCTGNAATATKFASAQSVALTGDVTGSASSQAGWSIATTLANSGVTAGRYTSVNVDAKGRVTAGNVKHNYTVAKSAAKNWYRIANANVSQTEATNTLHVQFMVTAYNSGQDTGYYERWFVDCEVFGRNAGIRIFGNTAAPFSQARVLYENTIADIDANDRPAIDLYLNYVMSNAATTVVVEELYNSGWTFVADGALSASSVPTGFENVASGVRNNGVERCSFADYVPYLNRQFSNITAAFTLADSYLYRSRTLNCTGTFTITVPSINSGYMWCVIKNKNTASGVITIHPSTTSVLIDGSNADITLQPGEYVCIHSAGANAYSLIADGRWMSKKADKATTLAGYGITDAKIASGVITLGSSTITPLTSSSSLNAAKLTGTASVNTTGTASNVTGTVAIANGGTGHGAQLVESTASDFNSYTESGDYHVGFPSGTANAPVASSDKLDCVLMVRKIGASASVSSASRYTQIAIVQNSTTSNQLRIFARKGYSDTGNWTAWSEVAFAENFCDLSTEQTISGCNKIISGNDKGWRCTSTNGTQEMRFCVGSGGTNRGIWDVKLNKWTLQMNNTDAYLNGQVNSGSDERLKTKIEPMPDELLDAWDEINWNQFKYLAEVESKGEEDAAIHAGIIAQRVVEAFARHGLDAEKYGFIGRDIPEDGSDGFWMVRYLEALALEAAYQRRRADRLEARIAALEEAMNG